MTVPASVKNEFYRWLETINRNDLNEVDKKLLNILVNHLSELYPLGRHQSKRAKKIGKLIEENGENADRTFPKLESSETQNLDKVSKLTRLEIGPFRGFRQKETFQFEKTYTYMYGPNGSGKSSFCEGLEYSLLGEIEECEAKRIPIQEYLKNVDVGKWEEPVAFGILDGKEAQIKSSPQLYRFCFIEKNRIDSFARLSATTPKNQQSRISALFGLDTFNQFVEDFTDTLEDKHLSLTNTLKTEFNELQVSHNKNGDAIKEENENLQNLGIKTKELIKKINRPTLNNLEEVKAYLDGDEKTKGKIAQLQEEIGEVVPADIDRQVVEDVDGALKKLRDSIPPFKENLKQYSESKEDVNFRDLYHAIRNLSNQGGGPSSVCPACLTTLERTTKNPFKHAEEQLENLKTVSELEGQLRESARDISGKITILNQQLRDFNKIIQLLKLELETIKELNAPNFEIKKSEEFIYSVITQLEKGSFYEEKRQYITAKIQSYNTELDAKRKQRQGLEEQQKQYSSFHDEIISIETKKKSSEEKINSLKVKIDSFKKDNKDRLERISEMEKTIERNNQFREAYAKLINRLKKYRDSLPVLLAQDISVKAAEFYNVINQKDPEFEKIEELFLPSESGQKIEICFRESNRRLDALQVLSEGHIKCLGLSLLLSKAVKENLSFLVFDDIVNAIDDDHRSGIVDLLLTHEDLKIKQQIITCHGPEFVKNLENKLGVNNRNKWVSNVQFIPPDIINERGVQIRNSESQHYLVLAEQHLNNDRRRESLSNCRRATENILDSFWNKMSKKVDFQLSIPMRTPSANPGARNKLKAIVNKLRKETFVEMTDIKEHFEKLDSDKLGNMLNKATHEQSEGVPEFERADIRELLDLLKTLESKIKSKSITVSHASAQN